MRRRATTRDDDGDVGESFCILHLSNSVSQRPACVSADAITTSGILLEIKCTRSRATFLERVANGGRGAIDNHYAQVQALLEVYDLPVALLCYWHKDEDEEGEDDAEDGSNADDEEDAEDGANADDAERAAPRTLSYELIIPRRAGWFDREC